MHDIGFADGEVCSYAKQDESFIVRVRTWNNHLLAIKFLDCIGVMDLGVGEISGFKQEDKKSFFMDNVLSKFYEQVPTSHPYNLYQFINHDGQPILEVIASSVSLKNVEDSTLVSNT